MKIKGLIGAPGVGKSTVMRSYLSELGDDEVRLLSWKPPQEVSDKKPQPITALAYPANQTLVFGHYDPEAKFPGTDTLSKSCGSSVRQFLKDVLRYGQVSIGGTLITSQWTFMWEGERFMNRPMFDFFSSLKEEGVEVDIELLVATEGALAINRAGRVQDPTWLKGMETRVNNIVSAYPNLIRNEA